MMYTTLFSKRIFAHYIFARMIGFVNKNKSSIACVDYTALLSYLNHYGSHEMLTVFIVPSELNLKSYPLSHSGYKSETLVY